MRVFKSSVFVSELWNFFGNTHEMMKLFSVICNITYGFVSRFIYITAYKTCYQCNE